MGKRLAGDNPSPRPVGFFVRVFFQKTRRALYRFGKVDILINNLKAVFFTTQAVVKHFRATNNKGRIINISSVHEELPFPHFTSYCASKGGVKMITRNLAVKLGSMGITINNVARAIATEINHDLLNNPEQLKKVTQNIPLGRMGEPEDVSGIVAVLM